MISCLTTLQNHSSSCISSLFLVILWLVVACHEIPKWQSLSRNWKRKRKRPVTAILQVFHCLLDPARWFSFPLHLVLDRWFTGHRSWARAVSFFCSLFCPWYRDCPSCTINEILYTIKLNFYLDFLFINAWSRGFLWSMVNLHSAWRKGSRALVTGFEGKVCARAREKVSHGQAKL